MTAACKLVHIHGLTVESLRESESIRQLHRADAAVVAKLHGAFEAISILRYNGHHDEAYLAARICNRIHDAAVLHHKLAPLRLTHGGIMRAAWSEYAKVLAAVERLAEEI